MNLRYCEKLSDIYQVVADKTIAQLEEYLVSKRTKSEMTQDEDEVSDAMLAQWWLDFGINRKITKRGLFHFGPRSVLNHGLVNFGTLPFLTGGMVGHSDTLRLQGVIGSKYLQVKCWTDPRGVGVDQLFDDVGACNASATPNMQWFSSGISRF
ncbi:hypothetical protein MBH78_13530 [Oceanimonas sp. NS1]|nr:hypothetical protein [Oceanimonas sp. NS1]